MSNNFYFFSSLLSRHIPCAAWDQITVTHRTSGLLSDVFIKKKLHLHFFSASRYSVTCSFKPNLLFPAEDQTGLNKMTQLDSNDFVLLNGLCPCYTP